MAKNLVFFIVVYVSCVFSVFSYFGKNKVKNNAFDWQEYQSEYFTLYYYTDAEEVARYAVPIIESVIAEYAAFFSIEIQTKIPVIIYHSPYEFQETTLLPYVLPEGVGGFTEYIKGRVVVPFNGSYNDFVHVIRHELIHEFVLLKSQQLWDIYDLSFDAEFPLWVHEGLAEYLSIGVSHSDDVFMRTLLLNGQFVPLERIWTIYGSYQMYKEGQYFWKYMTEIYGDEIIQVFFNRAGYMKSFRDTLERLTGLTFEQISYEYELWLKNMFIYSLGISYSSVYDDALPLDSRSIQYWPIEGGAVYVSADTGYIDIVFKKDNGDTKRLIRIGTTGGYEYISLHRLPMTVENGIIYCAVKHMTKDRIVVIDAINAKILRVYDFGDDISLIHTVKPYNGMLYIQAVNKQGLQGIYRVHSDASYSVLFETPFAIGKFDIYNDQLVYSAETGEKGFYHLYRYNLNDEGVQQITHGEAHYVSPFFTSNGQLFYISDRTGVTNIFIHKTDGTSEKLTGTSHYIYKAWASGDKVFFSTYAKKGYQIFQLNNLTGEKFDNPIVNTEKFIPFQLDQTVFASRNTTYSPKFSLDFAQADFSSSPRYGYSGGATFLLSDILSEHEIWFQLGVSQDGGSIESLLKKSNIVSMYINKQNNYYYYGSLFHFYKPFRYSEFIHDNLYHERQYGGSAGVLLPFSRFSRINGGVSYSKRERYYFFEEETTEVSYATILLEYSFDNTLWNRVGPLDGWRYAWGAEYNFKADSEFSYMSSYYFVDMRRYFRIFTHTCLAVRGSFAISEGLSQEKELLATGGSLSLRGYRYYELSGYKQLLFNTEYRFPIFPYIVLVTTGGEIVLPGIYALIFFDAGNCWSKDADNKLKGSYGWALQMGLGPTVLRLDFAKRTDFHTVDSGFETKFALGWNF